VITRAIIAKDSTRKIAIAAIVTLTLMVAAFFVALKPTSAATAAYDYDVRVPGGYESTKQIFYSMFPAFESQNLYYSNPRLGGGATLTLNAISLKASSDLDPKVGPGGVAFDLDVTGLKLSVTLGIVTILEVYAPTAELSAILHEPYASGEFGVVTAILKGPARDKARFYVNPLAALQPSPIPPCDYAGTKLSIRITFVEPRYTVTMTPLEVPQAGRATATLTVAPVDTQITGGVSLRFDEESVKEMGINGWIGDGGGTPPFTPKLIIAAEPWAKPGPYDAKVILYDWTSNTNFGFPVQITVVETTYTLTVEPTVLVIPRGGSGSLHVTVATNNQVNREVGVEFNSWTPEIRGGADKGVPTFSRDLEVHVDEVQAGTYWAGVIAHTPKGDIPVPVQIEVALMGLKDLDCFAEGLDGPFGMAFDGAGNLYVANEGAGGGGGTTISKITPSGAVSTFATGFNGPSGLAFDQDWNLWVSDDGKWYGEPCNIWKVGSDGTIIAGYDFEFWNPNAIAFDKEGSLFVADHGATEGTGYIYKISFSDGTGGVIRYAGPFDGPQAVAFDALGNVYTSDCRGTIWKIDPTDSTVSVFSTGVLRSTNGGLTFDKDGNLYASEAQNGATDQSVYVFTPDGKGTALVTGFDYWHDPVKFNSPRGLIFDAKGRLYITEYGRGIIWRVTPP